MNGYEIVDELDVKTLPAGKAYRFWFRSGSSQADTTCATLHACQARFSVVNGLYGHVRCYG
jgi:hypothetical protein